MATYPVVSRGIGRKPPSKIVIDGDNAYISLTRGFEAVVDLDDVADVSGYRWTTLINSQTGHAYAARYEKGKCILMHRALLDAPSGMWVDHEDGDGLNNRRRNIRVATPAQNMANKVVERRNKLGAKGVSDVGKGINRFRATIKPNGKTVHLGSYPTVEEARAAYRGAAKVLWGSFAHRD